MTPSISAGQASTTGSFTPSTSTGLAVEHTTVLLSVLPLTRNDRCGLLGGVVELLQCLPIYPMTSDRGPVSHT
jgi:hypothetical protein